jgi:thymidine phosphorylase
MVAAQGGPGDVLAWAAPEAPVVVPVPAAASGSITRVATRDLGLAVIELGGGRTSPKQSIDHAVGLADVRGLGERVEAGEPLAFVHGRDPDVAKDIAERLAPAFTLGATPPAASPVIVERL